MAERGIGQRELSRLLEKPPVYMNRVLQGKRTLEFAEILDICTAIGVLPNALFTAAFEE